MLTNLFLYMFCSLPIFSFFFFNDTATTEIYTLSLHDALPICAEFPQGPPGTRRPGQFLPRWGCRPPHAHVAGANPRSEEHTSELQSQSNLVCRLLLEKKKKKKKKISTPIQGTTARREMSRVIC